MLPDDYENVAQSVIATNFFGNNILQAITTKNYWDVVNEYKPLMHTWYVGLLMQFYVAFALLLFTIGRFIKNVTKRHAVNLITVSIIGLISIVLYLTNDDIASRFYYLPYRLFEFCSGAIVFYIFGKRNLNKELVNWYNPVFILAYLCTVLLLFVNSEYVQDTIKLISIVCFTSLLLILIPNTPVANNNIFSNKMFAKIGAASFSIFVWHQIIFAIVRYSFTNNLTHFLVLVAISVLLAILSVLSYHYIEQMKKTKIAWVAICVSLLLTTGMSFYIYMNAGVVRDIPELEVRKDNIHRGMWAEYCDRGYKYDKEFTDSHKAKWYVIGNSFGRDMVNIILESPIADKVEVVYSDMHSYDKRDQRFQSADIVFLSTLGVNDEIIQDIKARCSDSTKFFIIGEKNFGECNGQIYRYRYNKDYHNMTIKMENGYEDKNNYLKNKYPESYIDMIALVQQPDGLVRVFSDNGKFISQDCRHLTRSGAEYYALKMDWGRFMPKESDY